METALESDTSTVEPVSENGVRRTLREHIRSPVVELSVGNPLATFHIHRSLLIESSILFRKFFDSRTNRRTKILKILDFIKDGRHFEPFVVWMYNRQGNLLATGNAPAYDMGQVWFLAEEIESPEFLNDLADAIQRTPGEPHWYLKVFDELCAVEREDTPIGNFVIECLAFAVSQGGWASLIGNDLASDAISELCTRRGNLFRRLLFMIDELNQSRLAGSLTDPRLRYDCRLHVHETEEDREDCPRSGKVQTGPVDLQSLKPELTSDV